jgi:hypothetical protein
VVRTLEREDMRRSSARGRFAFTLSLLLAVARFLAILLLCSLAACARDTSPSASKPDVLLFAGRGTSPNDVTAFERLLRANHVAYATVDTARLDAMSQDTLRAHRLLIVPGGNFEEMGNAMAKSTPARLREAIGNGLNYLGVCAGAFFAGDSPYNGMNLTSGVRFKFYAASDRGIRKTAVPITVLGSPTIEHYWEDGPQLSGWGTAVAKYPDGTPAVVEGAFGQGWVVLTGTHPEAPENWRAGLTFTTPASAANAYAVTLIDAALHRKRLARD